jgi:hypothetical protein
MDRDYRRAIRTEIWHWNPACPKWPAKNFECSHAEPKNGTRCKECDEGR